MICDLKHTLRLYKEGKINDIVLSRSLSDYIRPITPTVKVRVVRVDTQANAGKLAVIQTLPERINGRLHSVIFIDQRTLTALSIEDFIEIFHKEVKNNTNYLKVFSKFLMRNQGMIIERSDAYAVLLEMYLMSYSQMSPAILKRVFDSGASFTDPTYIQKYHDKMVMGEIGFLKAQEDLELRGVPHWLTICAETIAVASGADENVYDVDYSNVDINSLNRQIKEVKKKEDESHIENYVSGDGVHTTILNATDSEFIHGRFIFNDKND